MPLWGTENAGKPRKSPLQLQEAKATRDEDWKPGWEKQRKKEKVRKREYKKKAAAVRERS